MRIGAEVELPYIPEQTQRRFGLAQEASATFKMEHWCRRDVFLLQSGRGVRLKKLQEGQVIKILSLPADGAGHSRDGASVGKASLGDKPEAAELADYRRLSL